MGFFANLWEKTKQVVVAVRRCIGNWIGGTEAIEVPETIEDAIKDIFNDASPEMLDILRDRDWI